MQVITHTNRPNPPCAGGRTAPSRSCMRAPTCAWASTSGTYTTRASTAQPSSAAWGCSRCVTVCGCVCNSARVCFCVKWHIHDAGLDGATIQRCLGLLKVISCVCLGVVVRAHCLCVFTACVQTSKALGSMPPPSSAAQGRGFYWYFAVALFDGLRMLHLIRNML